MRFLLFIFLLAFPQLAIAAEDSLYDPLPPEGSAFIRFMAASPEIKPGIPAVQGKKFPAVSFAEITPYYAAKSGKTKIAWAGRTTTESFEEKKFYTIAATKNGVKLLQDVPLKFQAKSLMSFYNFTSHIQLSLKLSERNIEIIGGVPQNGAASREINPVSLIMDVFDEKDRKIATLEPLTLERGAVYTVAAFEKDLNNVEFRILKNTTDTKF